MQNIMVVVGMAAGEKNKIGDSGGKRMERNKGENYIKSVQRTLHLLGF